MLARLILPVVLLLTTSAALEAQTFSATRADDWEALFDRISGWTGSDGIYSIPLSGDETAGAGRETPTLFFFGDTFIGEVGEKGERLPGWSLVNNTLAMMPAGPPDPESIRFFWGNGPGGEPTAMFVPETPQAEPTDWYWFGDGAVIDGKLYTLPLRMRVGFLLIDAVNIIVVPLDGAQPIEDHYQLDTPLYVPAREGRADLIFGGALLMNTVAAGSPDPDGYVYVYGVENTFAKKLLAARVRPGEFEDFSAWRYWDGGDWVPEIFSAAEITNGLSQEFSITFLPDGRYLAVYQPLGPMVTVRVGESPVGPFGEPIDIWHTPEADISSNVFTYNAKAHPHLSQPGELIVSYNVNSTVFGDHLDHAGLYRPRFIRIRIEP